ncbi:MAG: serine/threonine-protein kinase, partial [Planctomycetia bacterium]
EHVQAKPLSEVVKGKDGLPGRGPLPWREAAQAGRQLGEALAFAHEHAVVHRNIKPENVLLTDDGVAKLDNLIWAKAVEGIHVEPISMGGVGSFLHELMYLAPEAVAGDNLDIRSDIYALGATLFFAVTGRPPFDSPTPAALNRMIQNDRPPTLSTLVPNAPAALDAVLQKAMAKSPDARYATPHEFAADLAAVIAG